MKIHPSIARSGKKEQQRDYGQHVFDFRRIRGGWWAVILLTSLILNALAMLLNVWTGGAWPEVENVRRLLINFSGELFSLSERAGVISLLLTIVLALLVTLIWGPGTLARRTTRR